MPETLSGRLADHLRRLRKDRNLSLDQLADLSGVSRATLSRLENADVSPTADVLGRLCTAYGISMSRLLAMVEDQFRPLVRQDEQTVWTDPASGFTRRVVSPEAGPLAAEVLDCRLEPGAQVAYDGPTVPGLEHHLVLLEGRLEVRIEDDRHTLQAGDCLRYQLFGPSTFTTPQGSGARYILVLV